MRRSVVAATLTGLLAACAACPLILANLPARDLLRPSSSSRMEVLAQIDQQGWAFFTRSPREPVTVRYLLDDEHWSAVRGGSVRPELLFGLDRSSRSDQFALEQDLALVDEVGWTTCTGTVASCLSMAGVATVVADGNGCDLKDRALARWDPVPWAFRHETDRGVAQVVTIRSACRDEP